MEDFSVFHVFNRSIAGFNIFSNAKDCLRMVEVMKFYQYKWETSFSESQHIQALGGEVNLEAEYQRIDLLGYCVMPDHFHGVISCEEDQALSTYMQNIQNSYTRYFNFRHSRKGPLWVGRFKKVLVQTQEQLQHVMRYVHLNPTTAGYVQTPIDWEFSSYRDLILGKQRNVLDFLNMDLGQYREFVEDYINEQRSAVQERTLWLEP